MDAIKRLLVILLIFIFNAPTYAELLEKNTNPFFGMGRADAQLDSFAKQLTAHSLTVKGLNVAIVNIEDLVSQAKECGIKAGIELKDINDLKKTISLNNQIMTKAGVEYKKYIDEKETLYAEYASDCQLFIARSTDVLGDLKETLQEVNKSAILYRSLPIEKLIGVGSAVENEITYQTFYQASGLEKFSSVVITFYFVCLAATGLAGLRTRKYCRAFLSKNKLSPGFLYSCVCNVKNYVMPIMLLGITSLFFYWMLGSDNDQFSLPLLTRLLTLYFVSLFVARTLLSLFKHAHSEEERAIFAGKVVFKRFCYVAGILAIDIGLVVLLADQKIAPEWERITTLFWMTLLGISVGWFLCAVAWLFAVTHHYNKYYQAMRLFIMVLITGTLATEWAGYHGLVIYIAVNLLLSLGCISVVFALIKMTQNAIFQLNNNQRGWAQTIRYYLGLKPYHKIPELLVAKVAIFISLFSILVVVILQAWGLSGARMDNVILGFTDKFYLAGLEIHPLSIISAMLVFSLLIIGGRYLSAYVARHQQFSEKKDTQVAMVALMNYLIFAVALVIAMLMAGFNMTGLAIVAGALSVGIGLGLQNIVNNFVSGIILLLEKPIKPGDRIMIGATEGFVRKIRVRSTQITTVTKEDVIVPNSDLITQKVTNYMFRDKFWCVTSRVGIAYGSDVELTREVLLDIARAHADVMQEPPNEPMVFFKSFGDSSLHFELCCFIYDVNRKSVVASELNFAIDSAFRKHGIVIAFPQQDLHIVAWPGSK